MKTNLMLMSRSTVAAGLLLMMALPAYSFRPDQPAGLDKQPVAGGKPAKIRAISPEQRQAAQLGAADGLQIEWHSRLGTPASIRAKGLGQPKAYLGGRGLGLLGGGNFQQDAITVLDNLTKLYGLQDAQREFAVKNQEQDTLGFTHVRLTQLHRGLKVIGGDLIVHFDKNGEPYQVNGEYVPGLQLGVLPNLEANAAVGIAQQDLAAMGKPQGQVQGNPALVVFALNAEPQLAYELTLLNNDPNTGPGQWRYCIDAQQGTVLLRYNNIQKIAAPTSNGTNAPLTGNILAGEGGNFLTVTGWYENTGFYYLRNTNNFWLIYNVASSGWFDAATYAYRPSNNWAATDRAEFSGGNAFEITQRYYRNVHGRMSFNNAGITAQANIHEGTAYVNAYWDGTDFHFGDGDGVAANSLAVLDIAGHEFTHAVTEYTAGLVYSYESGALNESFSDILGACVEFYGQPDGRSSYPSRVAGSADWLCGEDSWLSSVALRDLRNPANPATVGAGNQQPSRYLGTYWYIGSGDNGGVHQNSGPQNFCFYLMCEGGVGNNDGINYNITGIGIANAERIAYRALTVYCTPSTDYNAARTAWVSAALDLNPAWAGTVGAAWSAIGIGAIGIQPNAISFRGNPGGPWTPGSSAFTLRNRGGAPMNWWCVPDQAWLDISLLSGTIPGGGSNVVTVSVNAAGNALPIGIYTNNLIFSNDVDNSTQIQQVKLLVGQPDYFTELFSAGDNDLDNVRLTFTPDGSTSFYAACKESATNFPTDPTGGTPVSLSDDSYAQITMSANTVAIYSRRTNIFFVGSNGYITMGSGDSSLDGSLVNHFGLSRISACFLDLNPGSGGSVTWKQTAELVAVTFTNVPQYGSTLTISFQIEMFFDGRIRITYLQNNLTGGLAGLSAGGGLPANFTESDLTGYSICWYDDLTVTPTAGLDSNGQEGGPFTPASATYTLNNVGSSPVNWSARITQPWLNLSSAGGSLSVGGSTNVVLSINTIANALTPGIYVDNLTVSNLNSGYRHTRNVFLRVAPIQGHILVLDSVPPATDTNVPFGSLIVGVSRTEYITITNTDSVHGLIISNIAMMGGGYVEDFNDGLAQDWVPLVPTQWQVVSGEYRAQAGAIDQRMQSLYFGQSWADCSAQATFRRTGDAGSAARIILRATDNFNGPGSVGSAYVFAISGDGSYYVGKYVSGVFSMIQSWITSPYLNVGSPNIVLANIQGSALRVYFNGNLAWSGSDSDVSGAGRMGLLAYSGSASETVHYIDNIQVGTPLPLSGELSAQQQLANAQPLAGGTADVAPPNPAAPSTLAQAAGQESVQNLTITSGPFVVNNVPTVPYTLAPNGSLTMEVIFTPTAVGSNQAKVIIDCGDVVQPRTEVTLLGTGMADYLNVTPSTGLISQGPPGGPFTPNSIAYTLSNAGPSAIDWTASHTQTWVAVSLSSGSLLPGQTASVLVSLTPAVNGLPSGQYADSVLFSNVTTHATERRAVDLFVVGPFFDDFDPNIDLTQWSAFGGTVGSTVLATNYGGYVSAPNSLWFGDSGQRFAASRSINTASGVGALDFWLRIASGSSSTWETADLPGEGVVVEYSIDNGTSWVEFGRYDTALYNSWTRVTVGLPVGAQTTNTRFQWRQLSNSGTGFDHWALDNVQLSGPLPPSICTQPQPQTAPVGGSATFCVVACGTAPFSYSWRSNGVYIPGANQACYTINNCQISASGSQFSCLVSNGVPPYTALSSNASLTVITGMVVAVFDNPAYVDTVGGPYAESDTVQASLANCGYIVTTFTDITNAVRIYHILLFPEQEVGALAPALTAAERTALTTFVSQGGLMIVHGSYTTSRTADLLNLLFGFAVQEVQVNTGLPFARTAAAAGTPFTNTPVSITTQNGTDILNSSSLPSGSKNIYESGGQSAVSIMYYQEGAIVFLGYDWFDAAPLGTQDGGWLSVLCNAVRVEGTNFCIPPIITAHPDDQLAVEHGSATFCVAATGTAPLNYFWYSNEVYIPGINQACYTINDCRKQASGSRFSCLVSNECGTALSSNATLRVLRCTNNVPVILCQPASQQVLVGGSVTFCVCATNCNLGNDLLTYTWQRNGVPISEANQPCYTLTNCQLSDSGSQFDCIIINAYGRAISSKAVLSVSAPTIFVFCNPASSIIRSNSAQPYPSLIEVSNLPASATNKVTVTLSNLAHVYPNDLDILLVGPAGQKVMLMSDAVGGSAYRFTNVTITFDDNASQVVPATGVLTSRVYRCVDYQPGDVLPVPAPVGPYDTNLSAFAGSDPNGIWSLYIADDYAPADNGFLGNGWCLQFEYPMLQIAASLDGNNLVISWPAGFAGHLEYTLEFPGGGLPPNWILLPDNPVVIDGRNIITLPVSGEKTFYRLRLDN